MSPGGPALFARFAFPPNHLGYCGPSETGLLPELMTGGEAALGEMRHAVQEFSGAWPYLELIAACTGLDPLDRRVVEAYWVGSPLLERVDVATLGESIDERFRRRAGLAWKTVVEGLNLGARPTHSFHVFCVYPWVGLLRSGVVDQALNVLDRCRIRWGEVIGFADDRVLVGSRPLIWDGRRLSLAPERVESVQKPPDDSALAVGDVVAMHWDYICQKINRDQRRNLMKYHDLHVAITNRAGDRLASRVEG